MGPSNSQHQFIYDVFQPQPSFATVSGGEKYIDPRNSCGYLLKACLPAKNRHETLGPQELGTPETPAPRTPAPEVPRRRGGETAGGNGGDRAGHEEGGGSA